jgi:hypothetical protein
MTSLPYFEAYLEDELSKGHADFMMHVVKRSEEEHPEFTLIPESDENDSTGTELAWIAVGPQLVSMQTFINIEGRA